MIYTKVVVLNIIYKGLESLNNLEHANVVVVDLSCMFIVDNFFV